ncbi:phosphate ABC transporter ATP-binding protein [Rossellomorea marisflavi]|uniref:Phosphate ABC transporter ATP-binding protein n=1 Tax=Rossellomorea marisflavi TaxID=189381 RepID=A0A5D4RZH8_9BACI|nr:phosphate ABC transporter ATP-binding protein PstB [Rossellomorea marisflavi]KQU59587.1 phosphate ABC transporter ATP-binding protein [Bacillus sp. Leaf406]MBV6683818.1 phosphate ABC transporter ATP-binding protein PstB [Bacillus sp. JRC01]TYS56795.1 phosphate ABC transporter ATP-binding protein [Rossellomorea marisflavi]WJV20334.1 phosphate ABC transporter ATP-binding protein PstB [Rossellomorea marisflavi]
MTIEMQARPVGKTFNPGNDTILDVQNLDFFYGDNHAVKDINMKIEKNAVTALIGPSGCGKSTFLRTINRMNDLVPIARAEGKIMYEDVNLLDKNIDVVALRKEIGMVFQKPNPFNKSIYENITHGLTFSGIKKKAVLEEIVEESLTKAALWDEVKDRLHTSAHALSGGQQQRLCIARTIAMKPTVMLLDEPCSALDPISNAKIEELIADLKKDYSIVIVTHNMGQASRVSDKTAFFYNGDLIEFDQTEKIFTNPSEKRTEEYISGRFS